MISDLLSIYNAIWKTAIGKAVLLLLYALSTNVAYAVAARLVNELIKYDTSGLTYTVTLVAILLAPLFVFAGIYIVFGLVLVFGQLYLMFTMQANQLRQIKCLNGLLPEAKENYPVATFIARLIAFPVALGFLLGLGKITMPIYGDFVEQTTTSFIYNIEASKYSRCKVEAEERVIKVNDQEIIVVTKVGKQIMFVPQICIPILKP